MVTSARLCFRNSCLDTKALCYMSFFTPTQAVTDEDLHIITVDFNAWEYSGFEPTWAGLIASLDSKLEEYFGWWKVRLTRLILKRHGDIDHENDSSTAISRAFTCLRTRHKLYAVLLLFVFIVLVSTPVDVMTQTGYLDARSSWLLFPIILISLAAIALIVGMLPFSYEEHLPTYFVSKSTYLH